FNLHASGGSFEATALTPSVTLPLNLGSYRAVLELDKDSVIRPATTVRFTGPAGSSMTNLPADPQISFAGSTDARYASQAVAVTTTAVPKGGPWTVRGGDVGLGTGVTYRFPSVPDPQTGTRLVLPLPTVTPDDEGFLSRISWIYRNRLGGNMATPSFIRGIEVQLDNAAGSRIYNSGRAPAVTTSIPVLRNIPWTCVGRVSMAYDDTLGNAYVVRYEREAAEDTPECRALGEPVNGGAPFSFAFNFAHGTFSGSTGLIDFPSPIAYYSPQYRFTGATPPASVFFTGPIGSSLDNTESCCRFIRDDGAGFTGPSIGPRPGDGIVASANPPGGTYVVRYQDGGVLGVFDNVPDPDSATRGLLIVPMVTLDGDTLTGIDWVYTTRTGASVPAQPYMAEVLVSVDGLVGCRAEPSLRRFWDRAGHDVARPGFARDVVGRHQGRANLHRRHGQPLHVLLEQRPPALARHPQLRSARWAARHPGGHRGQQFRL
ncbi:MAG: hypothetical protein ACRDPR_24155, partial [Nocardioidaceae bacterium]